MPCNTEIFAVVFPLATAATWRASRTATDRPARCIATAVVSPVIPAPTTATSTRRSPRSPGYAPSSSESSRSSQAER